MESVSAWWNCFVRMEYVDKHTNRNKNGSMAMLCVFCRVFSLARIHIIDPPTEIVAIVDLLG